MAKEATERAEADYIPNGVSWIRDAVAAFEPDAGAVVTRDGTRITYDQLVVAVGIQLDWHKILVDSGAELHGCELAMKMFKRSKEDLVPQVKDVITAATSSISARARRSSSQDGSRRDAASLRRGVHADLIVMSTRGHDAIGDVLRGSHTERVIREARCPVLSVPDRWIVSGAADA